MDRPVEESGVGAVDVAAPKKKNRAGTFGPGGIHPGPLPPEPEDETIPELLRDLRHVRTKGKREDRTPSRKQLRALSEKDYKTFLAMWKEEERAFAASSVPKVTEEGQVEDVGTEKAEALIESLLAEWEATGT